MPYNVIILSSTVIALAFGSVFNLVVRRFVGLEPGDVVLGNRLRGLVLRLIHFIRAQIAKRKVAEVVVANGTEKKETIDTSTQN